MGSKVLEINQKSYKKLHLRSTVGPFNPFSPPVNKENEGALFSHTIKSLWKSYGNEPNEVE